MKQREPDDLGFTLLEVVVAMVIFGIVASSTAVVLVRSVGGSSDNRARAAAANIAAQSMDSLRQGAASAQGYTDLVSRQLPPVTLQGRTYSVFSSVSAVTKAGTGSPCTAGGLTDEIYKKVGVTVSWPAAGPVQPVRSDTIIQNPGVAADPTTGALGVVVTGPDGPEARVPVNLSSGRTALTDDSGCAYFSGLATGNYTATASQPGYVDQAGNATAFQTVGVQPANAKVLTLAYAPASTPQTTFATVRTDGTVDSSYAWFGTSGYTLRNDSVDRSGSTATRTATPAPGLYPFASGYDVWLGACASEAPSRRVNFPTKPGTSPQVTVPVGGLTITNNGTASVDVVLRHVDAAACTTTYTGTVPPRFSYSASLPFGEWSATTSSGAAGSPSTITLTDAAPTSVVTFP